DGRSAQLAGFRQPAGYPKQQGSRDARHQADGGLGGLDTERPRAWVERRPRGADPKSAVDDRRMRRQQIAPAGWQWDELTRAGEEGQSQRHVENHQRRARKRRASDGDGEQERREQRDERPGLSAGEREENPPD